MPVPRQQVPRTVLIVTAILPEYKAVVKHLHDCSRVTSKKGRMYTKGVFREGRRRLTVYLVEAGAGNTEAAITTTHAIEDLEPDVVLMIGVAGGLKDVSLGDVVVGSTAVGYETGKDVVSFQSRDTVYQASHRLNATARAVRQDGTWWVRAKAKDPQPNVEIGAIAAGEKVVASRRSATFKLLRSEFSHVLAVEMEGKGVLAAAHAAATDAIVIRGISDLCTAKKRSDEAGWQPLAARNASCFGFELLSYLIRGDRDIPIPRPPRLDPSVWAALPPPCRRILKAANATASRTTERLARLLTKANVSPRDLVQSIKQAPPSWFKENAELCWEVLAWYALAHEQFAEVADLVAPIPEGAQQARWLARCAYALRALDPSGARSFSDQALALSSDEPFVQVVAAVLLSPPELPPELVDAISAKDVEDYLSVHMYRAQILAQSQDFTGALTVVKDLRSRFPEPTGTLVFWAATLVLQVEANRSDDPQRALETAFELALRARDLRRKWRGGTGDAVALAAEIALASVDAELARRVITPAPEGDATDAEAVSPRVTEVSIRVALMLRDFDLADAVRPRITDDMSLSMFDGMVEKAKGDTGAAVAAFRAAATSAPDSRNRFGPLFQLATLGQWPLEGYDELRRADPELADRVLAAHKSAEGDHLGAQVALRPWVTRSRLAAEYMAQLLAEAGDIQGALDAYLAAFSRFRLPYLLAAAMETLIAHEAYADAEEIGRRALLELPAHGSARSHVLRRLLEMAAQRAAWGEVEAHARALLRQAPDAPRIRWALVRSLVNQARMPAAWDVICGEPELEPETAEDATLKIQFLARHGGSKAVQRILDLMAEYGDSEQISASALMAIYSIPNPQPISTRLKRRLHAATEDFFARFPESPSFRRLTFSNDEELLQVFRSTLEPDAQLEAELYERVANGQLPYGVLAATKGRPYMSALLMRLAGWLTAHSSGSWFDAAEQAAIDQALTVGVVIDPSVLAVMATDDSLWDAFVRAFPRILVADIARLDAAATADELDGRPAVFVGWRPRQERPVIMDIDEEHARRLSDQARWVLEQVNALDGTSVLKLSVVPELLAQPENLPWLAALEAASRNKLPLWCDDAAARVIAQGHGIPAFGSVSLAALLTNRGQLDAQAFVRWRDHLITTFVADLPLSDANFLTMAAQTKWETGAISALLARPVRWHDRETTFRLYQAVCGRVSREASEYLPGWLAAAILGATYGLSPTGVIDVTSTLAITAAASASFDSMRFVGLLAAARQACEERGGDDPYALIVRRMYAVLSQDSEPSVSLRRVMEVVARLSESDRHEALRSLLQLP